MKAIALLALLSATPALADQPKPYVNAEYGLRLSFPANGSVCTALSGDHPHGFYARYDRHPAPCRTVEADNAGRVIGVYASYNPNDASLAQALEGSCNGPQTYRNITKAVLHHLSFRNRPSLACLSYRSKEEIVVTVVTFGGKKLPDNNTASKSVPSILYVATLVTRPSVLKTDLTRFRAFLDNVRIAPPV